MIIACGLYFISNEGKLANENTGFIIYFGQKKRKENFTLCLVICKIIGKNCSNILKWDFQKSQKKNTHN